LAKERNARKLTLWVQHTNLVVWMRGASFVKPNDCPSTRGEKHKEIEKSGEMLQSVML